MYCQPCKYLFWFRALSLQIGTSIRYTGRDDQLLDPQTDDVAVIIFYCLLCSLRQCQKQSFRFRALSRLIGWTRQDQLDQSVMGQPGAVLAIQPTIGTAQSSNLHWYVALSLRLIYHPVPRKTSPMLVILYMPS